MRPNRHLCDGVRGACFGSSASTKSAFQVVSIWKQPDFERDPGTLSYKTIRVADCSSVYRGCRVWMPYQILAEDGEGLVSHLRIWIALQNRNHPRDNICRTNLSGTASLARQAVESDLANRRYGIPECREKYGSRFVSCVMVKEVETASSYPRIIVMKRGGLDVSDRPATSEKLLHG